MFYINKETNLKFYFIGIGGIGMSGIAQIMHNRGFIVAGSDISSNSMTKHLEDCGIHINVPHASNNITNDIDFIVRSSSITGNNPEIHAAQKYNIPIIHRSHVLAEIMRDMFSIAVTGSHGKTTTTAMLSYMFRDKNPTVITGGIMKENKSNIKLGSTNLGIFEVDESDCTIYNMSPDITIITCIDTDHVDFFQNMANMFEAYRQIIHRTSYSGFIIYGIRTTIDYEFYSTIKHDRRIIAYTDETYDADIKITKIYTEKTKVFCEFYIATNAPKWFLSIIQNRYFVNQKYIISVNHIDVKNIANIAVCFLLWSIFNKDEDYQKLSDTLCTFPGVEKRLDILGKVKNVVVIDDYAHHWREITSLYNSLKNMYGKVLCVLQLHRYTRIKYDFQEYVRAASLFDRCCLVEIYAAYEDKVDDISMDKFIDLAEEYYSKQILPYYDIKTLYHDLLINIDQFDCVVFVGAGDITYTAHNFVTNYGEK